MTALKCGCPGAPYGRDVLRLPDANCHRTATQEDFLCDHCREFRCPEVETREQWDAAMERVYPWLGVVPEVAF